jgi:hypothetical protein
VFVCVYSVFVLSCVGSRADPPFKEPNRLFLRFTMPELILNVKRSEIVIRQGGRRRCLALLGN